MYAKLLKDAQESKKIAELEKTVESQKQTIDSLQQENKEFG